MSDLIQPVAALLREVAETTIMPVFGTAAVQEKSPGDVVTEADQASEAILTPALAALLPGSRVVGEEAAHADDRLLRGLGDGAVWLVDPLDGTNNFAAGRSPFAMMVALVRDDRCVAGWIHEPVSGRMWTAEAGAGAFLDDERVTAPAGPSATPTAANLSGRISTSYLPAELLPGVEAGAATIGGLLPSLRCAGREYPDVITGEVDFATFWRTLPWDHLPGVLLATEAGCVARRPDGTDYVASRYADPGLIVAADEPTWRLVADTLFGGVR